MAVASSQFRRQMCGDAAGGLLHPQGPQYCRNHAKDNVRAMREKERQLRGQRIMQAAQPPAELFKLKQFAEAKSRLFEAKAPRAASVPAGPGRRPERAAAADSGADEATDDASNAAEIGIAEFEEQVAALIRKHGNKQQPTVAKCADGVPAYLRKMQDNAAEQKKMDEAERNRPRLPPGYRQMPPDEVAETLQSLQKKRQELEADFRRLPLKIETDGQKRRQKAVLDKIEESDRAIKVFSQPTVLVEA